jgi:hypothetical protein
VRPIHRGYQGGTLSFPPVQTFDFGASPAIFGLNLLAQSAIALLVLSHVDKSHTACFASAVLIVASVSKAGPAPVSAGKSFLIVKAHAYQIR